MVLDNFVTAFLKSLRGKRSATVLCLWVASAVNFDFFFVFWMNQLLSVTSEMISLLRAFKLSYLDFKFFVDFHELKNNI